MGLFGAKNDEVAQAILKVQSAIAILNGVQSIANVLNKDSILMLKLKATRQQIAAAATTKETIAETANTAATVANTTAQKGWNVAKAIGKAMFGDFTGLLLLGAAALGTYAIATADATSEEEEHTKALEREKEAQKNYYDTLNDNLAKSISSYNKLKYEYASLRTEHEKKEWIDENQKAFEDLGLSVTSVADADNVLIGSTSNVIQTFKVRAKMAALAAKYQDIYNKALEGAPVAGDKIDQAQIERDFGKIGGVYYTQNYGGGLFGNGKTGGTLTQKGEEFYRSRALKEAEAKGDAILKEIDKAQKELDNMKAKTPQIVTTPEKPKKPTTTSPKKTSPAPKTAPVKEDTYAKDKARLEENYNKKLLTEIDYKKQLTTLEKNHLDSLLKAGTATQADVDRYAQALKDQAQIEIKVKYDTEITELQKKLADGMIDNIQYANSYESIMRAIYEENLHIGTVTEEITDNYKLAAEEAEKIKKEAELTSKLDSIEFNKPKKRSSFEIVTNAPDNSGTIEGIREQMDYNDQLIAQLKNLQVIYEVLGKTGSAAYDRLNQALDNVILSNQTLSEEAAKLDEQDKKKKKTAEIFSQIDESVQAVGGSLSELGSAFEAPELNIAGIIAQGISNMVLGASQAIAQAGSLGPFGWIAASAVIMAQLASIIAQVHSVSGYADGGIVEGPTSGDHVLARLNGGEMVFNARQQSNLFRAIDSGNFSFGNNKGDDIFQVDWRIKGSDLYGVMRNFGKSQAKTGKKLNF